MYGQKDEHKELSSLLGERVVKGRVGKGPQISVSSSGIMGKLLYNLPDKLIDLYIKILILPLVSGEDIWNFMSGMARYFLYISRLNL